MIAENMKIKKLIKYYLLGESLKEIELNRILDKIGKKKNLTDREKNFLDLYQTTREEEMKDFMLLSKNSACNRVGTLIENGKKVFCDLTDKNGKFGLVKEGHLLTTGARRVPRKNRGSQWRRLKNSTNS